VLSDPGETSALGPLPRFDVAFRLFNSVGSRENSNFGAQSHGPPTRCLRFAGWVAPPPRKTRFRMAGQPFRAGVATRRALTKGFRSPILLSQALPGAPKTYSNDPGESLIGATFHPKIANPGFFGDFLREIIACNLDARRQAVKTGRISRNKSGV
jgi:hypothetical protein